MGAVGQDFVQHALNTQQPQQAIRTIQAAAALRDARAKPLLSLLDHMGVSRCACVHGVTPARAGRGRRRPCAVCTAAHPPTPPVAQAQGVRGMHLWPAGAQPCGARPGTEAPLKGAQGLC